MIVELQRAGRLGIRHVVLHPGSYTTSSEAAGLATIAKALDECFRQTSDLQTVCLLENTAGQGSNLGWRFEHLAEIISRTAHPKRLAVCIDTCHTFAAGYPLGDSADYQQTIEELDRVVGIAQVRAIHLNDSKTPFGSRKDRHEHIGRGEMGLAPFWNLLNDPRWANIPMYLETEKGIENGRDLDEINLRMLRNLIGGPQPKPAKTT
jgi:deoxyribonuclease-4